jgi:LacI family transcriptional regulator
MSNGSPDRPTLRDIADMLGVSVATVSRALNNSPGISAETRSVVLEALERNSFTRWRRPRQTPKAHLISVRCTYGLDEYFGAVVSGIAQSLRQHNKRLVLCTEWPDNGQTNLQELLMTDTTEGAILVLPPEHQSALGALRGTDYPFVLFDPREAPPADVAAVSVANSAGARAATQHLIDLGHTRIAMIAGPSEQLSSTDRVAGYREALTASGQVVPDDYVRFAWEPDITHGEAVARAVLDLAEPPSAIVAFNDKLAIGAMQAAAERGLSVPGDLSVIGFDSLELGRVAQPPLTTVRQPVEEMARMAVEMLMRLINGREIEALHVELRADLVLRGSTSRPR